MIEWRKRHWDKIPPTCEDDPDYHEFRCFVCGQWWGSSHFTLGWIEHIDGIKITNQKKRAAQWQRGRQAKGKEMTKKYAQKFAQNARKWPCNLCMSDKLK